MLHINPFFIPQISSSGAGTWNLKRNVYNKDKPDYPGNWQSSVPDVSSIIVKTSNSTYNMLSPINNVVTETADTSGTLIIAKSTDWGETGVHITQVGISEVVNSS